MEHDGVNLRFARQRRGRETGMRIESGEDTIKGQSTIWSPPVEAREYRLKCWGRPGYVGHINSYFAFGLPPSPPLHTMSTLSLARYSVDTFQAPLYSADPLLCETGFYQARSSPSTVPASTLRPPGGEFVKESKGGNLRLRLYRQTDNASVPVFGIRGPVEGKLELSKPKGLVFVAIRVRVSSISSVCVLTPRISI